MPPIADWVREEQIAGRIGAFGVSNFGAHALGLFDGKLDIVTFGDLGFFARLRAMSALIKGAHNSLPRVATTRARRAVFEFDSPPSFETDGEWRQTTGACLVTETLPKALRVCS